LKLKELNTASTARIQLFFAFLENIIKTHVNHNFEQLLELFQMKIFEITELSAKIAKRFLELIFPLTIAYPSFMVHVLVVTTFKRLSQIYVFSFL
jgi:uncharacterized membrane protein YoaK (UPF0700 family)